MVRIFILVFALICSLPAAIISLGADSVFAQTNDSSTKPPSGNDPSMYEQEPATDDEMIVGDTEEDGDSADTGAGDGE